MKQYFLKVSGMATLALLLHVNTRAQDVPPPPPPPPPVALVPDFKPDDADGNKEIIIRKKNDKDIKVTVEVRDGKLFINGKPAEEYSDDNLTVREGHVFEDNVVALASPDLHINVSPFKGGWSYKGDDFVYPRGNQALLGVTSQDKDEKGARIAAVTPGSGAEKAGLKKDDIITMINDIKIASPARLTEVVHQFKPGDKVTVAFLRDGKEEKVVATLGRNNTMTITKDFDFSMPQMEKLQELSDWNRTNALRAYSYSNGKARLGIKAQDTEDGKGAKVLDVDDDSPADKAGIKEGDTITLFDGKPVNNAEDLANMAREGKDKYTHKINLTRDGKTQEVEVKIPKKLKTADL